MPSSNAKLHILWPSYRREPAPPSRPGRHSVGDAVITGVRAACDAENDKRLVDDLRTRFVRYFGPGWYMHTETGERVDPERICLRCVKHVARASAGSRAR